MAKAESVACKKRSELILEEAEKIRAQARVAPEKEKLRQLITFSLATGWYAVDINYVRHTFWAGDITPVPGLPDYILGVTSFMGEIISVVDLCPLLELKRASPATKPSLIVVDCNSVTTSLFVDGLGSIIEITESAIDPTLAKTAGSEFVCGSAKLDDVIVTIIDLEELIKSEKMRFE